MSAGIESRSQDRAGGEGPTAESIVSSDSKMAHASQLQVQPAALTLLRSAVGKF